MKLLDEDQINILLVDDKQNNLLALESILRSPDRNLVRANSGDEALRYLLDMDVAVILLDVHMPGISGLDTAALIRGRERSRTTPIIFLTADNNGGELASRGYSLGAVDFIQKPLDTAILQSKVNVFVDLFRQTQTVKTQAAQLHEQNIELENANLLRLSRLVDLGQQLAAERDPMRLINGFCQSAREITHAGFAIVNVFDEGERERGYIYCLNGQQDDPAVDGEELFSLILDQTSPSVDYPTVVDALDCRKLCARLPQGIVSFKSLLIAPIRLSSRHFGWLCLMNQDDDYGFTSADERLAVTMTNQAAVAYENARLYARTQQHAEELKQEVAERILAERERARLLVREQMARAEAEAANRTKDEFLATLSHELRTPLTAILGWAHLLRSGRLAAENVNTALETIERNAKSQSQLIDDLLDVSRILAGKLRLDVRDLDVADVVETALQSIRPNAESKGIALDVEFCDYGAVVKGDPIRLQQIVWNLMSNAIKFTPTGGNVCVRLERGKSGLLLEVSDTGVGISAEFIPHVFDRFRQADGTTTRVHGGLGLGLAIVHHLVELHGGSIGVESDGVGTGATFTVTLPINADADVSAYLDREAEVSLVASVKVELPSLSGVSIMVVEDDQDTLEIVTAILNDRGATTRGFSSVAEAIAGLERDRPDVIVSDIGLPEEDGFSFIQRLKENHHLGSAAIPSIALTAYASKSNRQEILAAGFDVHISKPLDPSVLIQAIAELAREKIDASDTKPYLPVPPARNRENESFDLPEDTDALR